MAISFRTYQQGHKAGVNDKRFGLPPLAFTSRDYIVSRRYIEGYQDGYHGRAATAPLDAEGTRAQSAPV